MNDGNACCECLSYFATLIGMQMIFTTSRKHELSLNTTLIFITVIALFLAPRCSAQVRNESDDCRKYLDREAPKFRIARKYKTGITQPGLALYVSVASTEVTQEKLLSLACKLDRDYANRKSLFIWILDNYQSAKHFSPQGEGNDRATNLSFRASYGYFCEGDKCKRSFDWWPDPVNRRRIVHVDLGER